MKKIHFTLGIAGILGVILSVLPPLDKGAVKRRVQEKLPTATADDRIFYNAYLEESRWKSVLQIVGLTVSLICVVSPCFWKRNVSSMIERLTTACTGAI